MFHRSILRLLRSEEGPLLLEVLRGVEGSLQRYATWLSQRGDPRGHVLQLALAVEVPEPDATLAHELGQQVHTVDPEWWELIRPGPQVRHCGLASDRPPRIRFAFRCPLGWEQLATGPDPGQRWCDRCTQVVHRVSTAEELHQRARAGECVAVPVELAQQQRRSSAQLAVGRPDPLEHWARYVFPREPDAPG
ncbi:MAG TPA: hypothetical protein ENK18_18975 [Deltaproteobacteria bacterium]|nr:hypothetical protein [Deltaproteobacteria bacterium]